MTAKEYLSQLIHLDAKIKANMETVTVCFAKATGQGLSYEDTGTAVSVGNSAESKNITYIDSKEKLLELVNELEAFRHKATMEINQLKNNIYSALLLYKYVCNLAWEEVAERLGYNVDYTKKELHGEALQAFEREIMRNPTKTPKNPLNAP